MGLEKGLAKTKIKNKVIPDAAALNILNHFDFWSAVPVDGSASYAEIAQRTRLPQDVVYRVVQHATTLRLFAETEPGKPSSRIQHTSRSAALAKQVGLRALVSSVLDISSAPMMVLNEALDQFSRGKPALTQEMSETSFALLHGGGGGGKGYTGQVHKNSWDFLENDGHGDNRGWRQKTFVEFMTYIKEIFQLEGIVLDAVDWKAAGSAKLVDVSITRIELAQWVIDQDNKLTCAIRSEVLREPTRSCLRASSPS